MSELTDAEIEACARVAGQLAPSAEFRPRVGGVLPSPGHEVVKHAKRIDALERTVAALTERVALFERALGEEWCEKYLNREDDDD